MSRLVGDIMMLRQQTHFNIAAKQRKIRCRSRETIQTSLNADKHYIFKYMYKQM